MRLDNRTGEADVLEVNPNPDLADGCAFTEPSGHGAWGSIDAPS